MKTKIFKITCKEAMAIRYLFIVLILIVFVGCRKQNDRDISLNTVLVDGMRNDEAGRFDSFFRFSHYIALETNDSSLIGDADKIKMYKGNIYVQDGKDDKIVVFDSVGHYVRQYSHLGQGPGEYVGLGDFDIKEDTLYLMGKFDGCVLKYGLSDRYYGKERVPKAAGMYVLPDGVYALNLGLGRADNGNDKLYNSYAVCRNGNLLYENIPFNQHLLGRAYSFGEGHNAFYCYGDSVFTFFPFNDTIYTVSLKDGTLAPYLSLALNRQHIALDASAAEVLKLTKKLTPSIFAFYKWDDYLYCSFYYADNPRKYLLFSKDGSILFCGSFNLDKNKLPVHVVSYESDRKCRQMVSLVYPEEIFALDKRYGADNGLLRKVASEIAEESNPVLLFYDFKL